MRGKFIVTYPLNDGREVSLRVLLDVSVISAEAKAFGIGDQEKVNLEGTKFQEIVDIAGLSEGDSI